MKLNFKKPERIYRGVVQLDLWSICKEINKLCDETKISIDQAIGIYKIAELKRSNDLFLENAIINDERISSIKEIFDEILNEFTYEKIAEVVKPLIDNFQNNSEVFAPDIQEMFDLSDPAAIKMFQDHWHGMNDPIGRKLGYPECCIKEFGDDAPELMQKFHPTTEHQLRFKAAQIDGVYTGFIPCIKHAQEIIAGKIKLADLIENRDEDLPPFPLA